MTGAPSSSPSWPRSTKQGGNLPCGGLATAPSSTVGAPQPWGVGAEGDVGGLEDILEQWGIASGGRTLDGGALGGQKNLPMKSPGAVGVLYRGVHLHPEVFSQ